MRTEMPRCASSAAIVLDSRKPLERHVDPLRSLCPIFGWRPGSHDADVLHTPIVAIPSPLIGWVIVQLVWILIDRPRSASVVRDTTVVEQTVRNEPQSQSRV